MLIKIEIIARKLNMTQCEEIKKKIQKALLVHTLDGKRSIDFAKKYKRKYLSSWIREHM